MRAAILAGLLLAVPASAHQAPAGWDYDPECCHTRDCAQVSDGAVREVQGGYQIVIQPGTHPMVRPGSAPVTAFIEHGSSRIRVSGDEHKHVCLLGAHVFCVYVPPGGV